MLHGIPCENRRRAAPYSRTVTCITTQVEYEFRTPGGCLVALFLSHRVGAHFKEGYAIIHTKLGQHVKAFYKSSFSVELMHLYNCANNRDLERTCMSFILHAIKSQVFRVLTDLILWMPRLSEKLRTAPI